jgi:lysozyme
MNLLAQLKRDEGLRLTPYRDTVGKLTIGYGRNLEDNGITQSEADLMLINDIACHEDLVHQFLPWTDALDDVRRAVLVNMAFNMGIHSLLGFRKTLQAVHDGEYVGASELMLQSKWAEQVGPRAHRLALQMRSGEWQ